MKVLMKMVLLDMNILTYKVLYLKELKIKIFIKENWKKTCQIKKYVI